ncbi:MAG: hypothetical protein HY362_02050 [Candidatus Aenigmarchaeota archaeon]|nr:hypothetical protein [Candidatus Aenigmarchaeota archaeon]
MKYIFILGQNAELSKAEIKALVHDFVIIDEGKDFLLGETAMHFEMGRLGGTIKIAELLDTEFVPDGMFSVSAYLPKNSKKTQKEFAKSMKEKAKAEGKKSRYFESRKSFTTAVEILKKNLIGREIILVQGKSLYKGKTIWVYDPFSFKLRDTGRPMQRPAQSMPISLAKIMVNLSGAEANDTVLDPFCGYGTIVQEVVAAGFNAVGSDIDGKAITAATENLRWFSEKFTPVGTWKLDISDSRELSEHFQPDSISAIITEPFLGPPLTGKETEEHLRSVFSDLSSLYTGFFSEANKILRLGGKIVITLPFFKGINTVAAPVTQKNMKLLESFTIDGKTRLTRILRVYQKV